MANGHGGRRKGSGRPKGSKDKMTIGREVRLKDFMNGKTFVSPMEFLTTLMNDESADPRDRKDAARILMPYHHRTADKLGENADENAKTISNSKLFSIINGESERLS